MRPDIPINPEQRWEWLKYQLRTRGTSLAKVANSLKVSRAAVLNAKQLPYPRVERAIASELGLHPGEIWPERWNADGTPCRHRPNRAENRAVGRKSGEAAHICAKDSDSNAIAHRPLAREA
ncbi:MAG: helix-turn-helix domain-containing protein [Halomonas sp.]|nr:helix-turn-helix domain-containing protein [Halomonas sp.]